MPSRRTFLTSAALVAAGAAAAPGVAQTRPGRQGGSITLPENPEGGRYRPPHKFGIGGVQAGNAFFVSPDEEVTGMMQAAWEAGVRYFDTSPWYGLGLSERRLGHFLDDKDPDEYVLSTKIGRLLIPDASVDKLGLWKGDRNFRYEFDYSAEATRRSVEDSLQRLGIPKIDIVFIHDLSPDHNDALGGDWKAHFETAVKGAMPELTRMRDEGMIKAWGMGVNDIEPCLMAMEAADPDIMLCATQYSLTRHEDALQRLFPACREREVSIVVGAPYMSGFLAGVDRYLYSDAIPDDAARKRRRLEEICRDHEVDLRTAALQFTAAPDVVSATIPGTRNATQARQNAESMSVRIPGEFWEALKREGLMAEEAPINEA